MCRLVTLVLRLTCILTILVAPGSGNGRLRFREGDQELVPCSVISALHCLEWHVFLLNWTPWSIIVLT